MQARAAARAARSDEPATPDEAAILRIGVTGHRRHRLEVPDEALTRRIIGVLDLIRRVGKLRSNGQIEIISALAEGADEIAACAALKARCRLTALIPFKSKDYQATFSDKRYRPVFRDLVRQADGCIVLPGSLRDANAGYEAVGLETLRRSDIILTIWDGAPAQGRGGTPQILQAALKRRRPIIWIDATKDRAPRLLRRRAFGPCPRLENLARHAERVAARNIRQDVGTAARKWRAGPACPPFARVWGQER